MVLMKDFNNHKIMCPKQNIKNILLYVLENIHHIYITCTFAVSW